MNKNLIVEASFEKIGEALQEHSSVFKKASIELHQQPSDNISLSICCLFPFSYSLMSFWINGEPSWKIICRFLVIQFKTKLGFFGDPIKNQREYGFFGDLV